MGAQLQPPTTPPVPRRRGSWGPVPPRRRTRCGGGQRPSRRGARSCCRASDDAASDGQRNHQLRLRDLQGRHVAGRPDHRGRLRWRARAAPPSGCARRHTSPPASSRQAGGRLERGRKPRPARPTATAVSVTRKVDTTGSVCPAGTSYRVGNAYRRRQVQVAVVGDTVEKCQPATGATVSSMNRVRTPCRSRCRGAVRPRGRAGPAGPALTWRSVLRARRDSNPQPSDP